MLVLRRKHVNVQNAIDQLQVSLDEFYQPGFARVVRNSTHPTRAVPAHAAGRHTSYLWRSSHPLLQLHRGNLHKMTTPSLRYAETTLLPVAAILLNDVGLVQAMDLDGSSKKRGFSSKINKVKRRAKWPNEYMFRLEDEDPQYDTLETCEFVSGYLSIIEEVTPVNEANARLIRHLQYLRQLMDDCASLHWDLVRTAHRQVLMAIKYKRLRWDDTAAES